MSMTQKKTKKITFEWYEYGTYSYPDLRCDNPVTILDITVYQPQTLQCYIRLGWHNGLHQHPGGWRYSLASWVGAGRNLILLDKRKSLGCDYVRAHYTPYATQIDAVKAAIHEFFESVDAQLYGPEGSRLVYHMCRAEWEPLWDMVEAYTAHDNWLAEVRAPKKSAFVEQLDLF